MFELADRENVELDVGLVSLIALIIILSIIA